MFSMYMLVSLVKNIYSLIRLKIALVNILSALYYLENVKVFERMITTCRQNKVYRLRILLQKIRSEMTKEMIILFLHLNPIQAVNLKCNSNFMMIPVCATVIVENIISKTVNNSNIRSEEKY